MLCKLKISSSEFAKYDFDSSCQPEPIVNKSNSRIVLFDPAIKKLADP